MLLFACLLVAACGKTDPVAKNAAAPPDNMVGDAPSAGLAVPANAAAAEAVKEAAAPASTDGMTWRTEGAGRSATFGPPDSSSGLASAQLQFECTAQGLSVSRADSPSEGQTTLSFTGNGHVASLPMTATPRTTQGSVWRGLAKGDTLRAIGRTFAGPGPVQASVGGGGDLRLLPDAAPRAAIAACL